MSAHGLIIDNFAGGGGASTGIERALGRPVDYAINHNATALATHKANHPNTHHLCEDVFHISPRKLCAGRHVDLAWFSPDCKHFSKAKGGKPCDKKVRGLAWVAVRWAKEARPDIIVLENVEEFVTWGPLLPDGRPNPKKRGLTFKRFVGNLRGLGYHVEWRELVAADYGAPTTRKRFFLIARCDGRPIVWPEPTHAAPGHTDDLFNPRLPWRTAAECIDWSIPCPSIFLSKEEGRKLGVNRPLVPATMKRIAQGIKKYVIDCADPFIVGYHACESFRGQGVDEPLGTQTTENRFGLVVPYVAGIDNQSAGPGQVWPSDKPLTTVVTENRHALVLPHLVTCNHTSQSHRGQSAEEPLRTITAARDAHGVVAAHVSKFHGKGIGQGADKPASTIMGTHNHHSIATAFLSKFYGTNVGSDLRLPCPTVTSTGQHLAHVEAFLLKYYGTGCGQVVSDPLAAVTTRDRFGLVTIHGEDYQIVDIGLRMFQPRELFLAQGFPPDYKLIGTKTSQVQLCGNSVSPPVAEAIIRANCSHMAAVEVAA
jgi:DNA (cytosine-5)-methyltransferase 1